MTNREWLNSLSDEEFAKEYNKSLLVDTCTMKCSRFCKESIYDCDNDCNKNIEEWLKANKGEIINEI